MQLARVLLTAGAFLLLAGLVVLLLSRIGLPFGRLPGDIAYRGKHGSFFAPLGTSLLLSILLSALFYFLSRFRR